MTRKQNERNRIFGYLRKLMPAEQGKELVEQLRKLLKLAPVLLLAVGVAFASETYSPSGTHATSAFGALFHYSVNGTPVTLFMDCGSEEAQFSGNGADPAPIVVHGVCNLTLQQEPNGLHTTMTFSTSESANLNGLQVTANSGTWSSFAPKALHGYGPWSVVSNNITLTAQ